MTTLAHLALGLLCAWLYLNWEAAAPFYALAGVAWAAHCHLGRIAEHVRWLWYFHTDELPDLAWCVLAFILSALAWPLHVWLTAVMWLEARAKP